MPLEGTAFIALWNDRSPERSDYDVWHSREHVPERLAVPGMIRATRYAGGKGNLPGYFTLYVLEDIRVLDRSEYVHLLNNPTPWSRSMRPDFSRFLRVPCLTELSRGGGVGGWTILGLVKGGVDEKAIADLADELLASAPVTAVHFGIRDEDSASVPFSIDVDDADQPHGVLMIEGFDEQTLITEVRKILEKHAWNIRVEDVTSYQLAFVLNAASVPDIYPYSTPPS